MRDLARQGLIKRRRRFPKPLLKFTVIVVALLAAFVLVKERGLITSAIPGSGSVTLSDASKGLIPVEVGELYAESSEGESIDSRTIRFRDVKYGGSAEASGAVTRGAGSYSMTIEAAMPDPVGNKYQAWLVNGAGEYFDAGFLSGSKTSWTLEFRDRDRFSGYSRVWITLELTSEDGEPEQHVLEGSF